ncbi:MAG: SpoIIE family protein phosphatase, partial [Ignavibacteriales bacterium]|nr:SpoIIE family protein phosphatase [Ignavibacteriales bacterium]
TEIIKRLNALVEASNLLNSSLDLKKILSILLDLATKNLQAERGTIYLIDKEKGEIWSQVTKGGEVKEFRLPIGQGIAGTVAKTGKTVNLKDAYKDKRFDKEFDKRSGFKTKTMLCTPMKDKKGIIVGVFQILNKKKGYFTPDDQSFLSALSIPATLAIENARLHEAEIQNQRMERELEVAAQIQQQILPKKLPKIEGVQLGSMSMPCHAVGGDFYDVFKLDDHRIALVVADVSGKGIPAALLVSTLHASLYAYRELHFSSVDLATKLNQFIYENSTAEKFITFASCIFDTRTSTIHSVNAGHCFPLIIRADGRMVELKKNGFGLGMLPGSRYEEETVKLGAGDLIVLYTDGISESMNEKRDMYGNLRLSKVLSRYRGFLVNEIMDEIVRDVKKFSGNTSQDDDLTLVLLKVGS